MTDDVFHVVSRINGPVAGAFRSRSEAQDWARRNAVPIGPKQNDDVTNHYIEKTPAATSK